MTMTWLLRFRKEATGSWPVSPFLSLSSPAGDHGPGRGVLNKHNNNNQWVCLCVCVSVLAQPGLKTAPISKTFSFSILQRRLWANGRQPRRTVDYLWSLSWIGTSMLYVCIDWGPIIQSDSVPWLSLSLFLSVCVCVCILNYFRRFKCKTHTKSKSSDFNKPTSEQVSDPTRSNVKMGIQKEIQSKKIITRYVEELLLYDLSSLCQLKMHNFKF